MMAMTSLLTGVGPDRIRTDPFPHLVIHDALPPDLYAALADGFPGLEQIVGTGMSRVPSNRRYTMMAHLLLTLPGIPECWRDFARIHTDPAFLAEVESIFAGHWPVALLNALGGQLSGHRTDRLNLVHNQSARILMDARLEVNTPVHHKPSSARGPHLDTPNRLYSGLFYLRHPDDDAIGGDLELFRWRNGPTAVIDGYTLPDGAVERVTTIPYQPNTLVMFRQGIDAIHGVGIRHPTPHVRRYVFITAEIAENWLLPPSQESELA